MNDPVALISTETPIIRYFKHNIYYIEYTSGDHEYSFIMGDKEYTSRLLYELIRKIDNEVTT